MSGLPRLSAGLLIVMSASVVGITGVAAASLVRPLAELVPIGDLSGRRSADIAVPSSAFALAEPAGPPVEALPDDGLTADRRELHQVALELSSDISPKSVVGNDHGLFFAQNMVYRHSVTVYDRKATLVATIGDTVDLADFGLAETSTVVQGSPVEAVATADGRFLYVSNYEMSGPGYANPGNDTCSPGGWDSSFVYRIDTARLAIDEVIPVGSVPKFVALTPDDKTLLVANWCSYDLSVIDLRTGRELRRVDLGPYPRGIAVTADGRRAYVAVMGTTSIAIVDLTNFTVRWLEGIGGAPRHVVLSPDGGTLYVTLNSSGEVAKIDTASGEVQARVSTGQAPRTMAISDDGSALYVVNYLSNTMSKVRTADLAVLQTIATPDQPIGITYDRATRSVWVALYSGGLQVFEDRAPEDAAGSGEAERAEGARADQTPWSSP